MLLRANTGFVHIKMQINMTWRFKSDTVFYNDARKVMLFFCLKINNTGPKNYLVEDEQVIIK